jgi:predicted Rossmann fold nucleotide-binding protein DprA/Smf involved in DNA uptake
MTPTNPAAARGESGMNPERPPLAETGETGIQCRWAMPWSEFELDAKPPAQRLAFECETIHGIGNHDILRSRRLGLICSVQCPGSVVIKTFDAIRELRDAEVVVIGGFHSPMEQECLEFLLRGAQPVIICPARGIGRMRLPAGWREAIATGRLLLLSPFADEATNTTTAQAEFRNEFVAALSAAVLIPHASPGGKAEALARRALARGQTLFTFDDEANKALLDAGARDYELALIRGLG